MLLKLSWDNDKSIYGDCTSVFAVIKFLESSCISYTVSRDYPISQEQYGTIPGSFKYWKNPNEL